MGYIATDLARFRARGFNWYVFFLEDSYQDNLRRELSENFENLAREIGPDCLAVRGANRENFWSDVFYTYAITRKDIDEESFPLPGLLITDTSVSEIQENSEAAKRAKIILISLAERYRRPGSVTEILRHVSAAVRDPSAMKALPYCRSTVKSVPKSRPVSMWRKPRRPAPETGGSA